MNFGKKVCEEGWYKPEVHKKCRQCVASQREAKLASRRFLVGVGVDFLGVGVGANESVAIGIVPSFSFPSKYALRVETIDDGVVSRVSLAPSSSMRPPEAREDDGAQEKFKEIQEAYRVLSDEGHPRSASTIPTE